MSLLQRVRRALGMSVHYTVKNGERSPALRNGDSLTIIGVEHTEPANLNLDLVVPRCESRKRKGSRSWRCALDAGHDAPASFTPMGGPTKHRTKTGDRRW